MAALFLARVNRRWSGVGLWSWLWRYLGVLLVVCCSCCSISASDSNETFVPHDDDCKRHFEMAEKASPRPFPPEFLPLANRTSVTYDVKACGEADVILYAIDFKPEPEATRIHITLGKDNESLSTIQICGSECEKKVEKNENPLNCTEHVKFAVSWEDGGVNVLVRDENDTWVEFLSSSPISKEPLQVQSVFVAYRLHEDDLANTTSEWTVYGQCEEPADLSSMVTRGHMAGAVIAALVAGIICGVVCIRYMPQVITFIRERIPYRRKAKTREGAQTDEELNALVDPQSPERTQSPAGAGAGPGSPPRSPGTADTLQETKIDLALPGDNPPPPPLQETKIDLALPGDNPPPPPPTAAAASKRKATANTYTPYHEMGGKGGATPTTPTPKKDDVTAKGADASGGSRPRKKKKSTGSATTSTGGGRATSPLPALPGDDVAAAVAAPAPETPMTSGPEELYVNADAHVYEGMHHDAPIYENRNTGVYEALQPSAKDK